MKTYLEPNVELISLIPQDEITGDFIEGEIGVESAGDLFG